MKELDFSQVKEQTEFKKLLPGGYVAKIESVKDDIAKEYLVIEFDIAEGPLAGYYFDLYQRKGFWGGKFYRSYKQTALSFFKSFLTAVTNSNPGFVWTSNEQQLSGKRIGIVLGLEEHLKQDGSVGERTYVAETRSVDKIKSGDFKTPEKKCLKANANKPFTASDFGVDVENLPFK